MELKTLLLVAACLVMVFQAVSAEFGFQRYYPKTPEEVKKAGLKCPPGQMVMKVGSPIHKKKNRGSGETDAENQSSEQSGRRTHMNSHTKDESCSICFCSVNGVEEYCSYRPARNVNECIRMATLNEEFNRTDPSRFDHQRVLAYAIRRLDYIWHHDEIPYRSDARCRRSLSFYSNSQYAGNTTIISLNSTESHLDYANNSICFFCVCDVSGYEIACIHRNPWFCNYYRKLREPDAAKHNYDVLFQQDRPAYFRTLSYRLRRTMDDGIYSYLAEGGDALCCDHHDGHRRHLHNVVRSRIRQLRKKVPKENLLSGGPGGDYVDFVVNNDK